MSSSNYSVYSLIDPRTMYTRYVGITNDPKRRFYQHIHEIGQNIQKYIWIQDLEQYHLLPIMVILGGGMTEEQARVSEAKWIRHYLYRGAILFNKQISLYPPLPCLQWDRYRTVVQEATERSGAHPIFIESTLRLLTDKQIVEPTIWDRWDNYIEQSAFWVFDRFDNKKYPHGLVVFLLAPIWSLLLYHVPVNPPQENLLPIPLSSFL